MHFRARECIARHHRTLKRRTALFREQNHASTAENVKRRVVENGPRAHPEPIKVTNDDDDEDDGDDDDDDDDDGGMTVEDGEDDECGP